MRQRMMRTVNMRELLNKLKMHTIKTAQSTWHRRGEALSPATWRRWARQLSPGSASPSAIPALDGLRGVAVLLVISYHAYHPQHGPIHYTSVFDMLSYGDTGVQLFFVLSGFLLCLPYARWLYGLQAQPSTRLFYERRLLRVGPAYWVNVIILFLFSAWSLTGFETLLERIAYLHNLFSHDLTKHAGVLWTMSVEVQFYAALPFLAGAIFLGLKAIYRYTGKRQPALVLAVVAVLGSCEALSVVCEQLTRSGHWRSIAFLAGAPDAFFDPNSMPYWLGVFAVGMVCSFLYVWVTQVWKASNDQSHGAHTMASVVFSAGVLLALGLALAPLLRIHLQYVDLVFGGVYGLVVIGITLGAQVMRLPFESRALRFIGHISYSVYLWHLIVLTNLEPHLAGLTDPHAHMLVSFALDIAISIPLAYASYLLTERPFFSLRRRTRDTGVAVETATVNRPAARVVESPITTMLHGHVGMLSLAASRSVESDTYLQIGQVIAGYRLERQLGSSAHGMSFQARRVSVEPVTWKTAMTPERVVIKTLETPAGLVSSRDVMTFHTRFEREALSLQSVCGILIQSAVSAGVAQYITWSDDPRRPYVIRAYADGESLGSILARDHRSMPLDVIARYVTQIATALDYVHARGLSHGALTLDNVIVSDDDDLHVTDIGLQQLLRPITRYVPRVADPMLARYSAPERYYNHRRSTPAGDIYSLGVALYALVCGAFPFSGSTVEDVRRAQQETTPISPRTHRSDLSDGLESVMLKALAYSPKERFATAGDLAAAFTAAVEGAQTTTPVLATSSHSASSHG